MHFILIKQERIDWTLPKTSGMRMFHTKMLLSKHLLQCLYRQVNVLISVEDEMSGISINTHCFQHLGWSIFLKYHFCGTFDSGRAPEITFLTPNEWMDAQDDVIVDVEYRFCSTVSPMYSFQWESIAQLRRTCSILPDYIHITTKEFCECQNE